MQPKPHKKENKMFKIIIKIIQAVLYTLFGIALITPFILALSQL